MIIIMKYIVLLRGVNISGKNKISMKELKLELEQHEYQNVSTYLNSGNIIFDSDNYNEELIVKDISKIIKDKFNLNIPIFIMKYNYLKDLLNNSPTWWGTDDKNVYDNIIFIIPPTKSIEVYQSLGKEKENIEKSKEYKNSIFWSYSLKDYRKSNWWSKTANTSIKDEITIRTANTMKKILELCQK